jgi:hypothetical protein
VKEDIMTTVETIVMKKVTEEFVSEMTKKRKVKINNLVADPDPLN